VAKITVLGILVEQRWETYCSSRRQKNKAIDSGSLCTWDGVFGLWNDGVREKSN
jgi:hypothetical protein